MKSLFNGGAMNGLSALVNQVEAQGDKKITPDIAAQIIAWANQIIATLGGWSGRTDYLTV